MYKDEIKLGDHALKCAKCKDLYKQGGWSSIDLKIVHDNGHTWPGFAGEPCDYPFGGSDF